MPFRVGLIGLSQVPISQHGRASRCYGTLTCPSSSVDRGLDHVEVLGSPVFGSVNNLILRTEPFRAVPANGSASTREKIADRLQDSPVTFPAVLHPDSTMGRDVRLAEGVVVAAGVRLSANIHVARHVHNDQNAVIGNECTLCAFPRLNPQARVSGNVKVGRGASVGANATVLHGRSMGDGAIVGTGAVVTGPVDAATIVRGVPAR